MATNKIKHNNIISLENQVFTKKEIKVTATGGETFDVVIDKKFKDTEIAKLLADLVEETTFAKDNNLEIDVMSHIMILIIKNFTDIQFPKYKDVKKTYESEIKMLNALINLGIYGQIVSNFEVGEIDGIVKAFEKNKDGLKVISNSILSQEIGQEESVQ